MAAAPKEKAAAAGRSKPWPMSWALAFGIALFGLILTRSQRHYCATVRAE